MECIVYFNVEHNDEVKELHGLIFTEEGSLPTEQEYVNMFEDMGYHVRIQEHDQLVFVPTEAGAAYKSIRIRKVDTGKKNENSLDDNTLKSVVANLLPNKPGSI